jgi:three-Cys-motif partner protein
MRGAAFFDAPEQQSIIKTQIVTKYFSPWSSVMIGQGASRLAYIDLFSGPGVFTDGTPSTPIWILNHAIKQESLRARLVTMFNDKDSNHAERLRSAIDVLPGIETLAHRPQVSSVEVGSDIVNLFRGMSLIPTLFFIDPWGYKGLSLDLIGTAIKNWGCECIFFFNYNRIRPALRNRLVSKPMNDLFGEQRAEALRQSWEALSPGERQRAIMGEFAEAVREVGGRYVLPFGMRSQHAERTSHYIIFVTKHPLGYKIMKDVMYSLSSDDQEIRAFEYVPVKSPQLRLFDPENPYSIPALKSILMSSCVGKSMRVGDVYEEHVLYTQYLLRHVKRALMELESEGRVTIDPPADKRRKGTLADDKIVTFPT